MKTTSAEILSTTKMLLTVADLANADREQGAQADDEERRDQIEL